MYHLGCVLIEDDRVEVAALIVFNQIVCGIPGLTSPVPTLPKILDSSRFFSGKIFIQNKYIGVLYVVIYKNAFILSLK